MKIVNRLLKSRNSWKQKAIQRAEENRYLRKRLKYHQIRNECLTKALNESKAAIQKNRTPLSVENIKSNSLNSLNIWTFKQIQIYCVLLVLKAMVSFRASVRVVALNPEKMRPKVPHFTSVINWCLRIGLQKLRTVGTINEPWVAMIDMSIDVGFKNLMVILRVPLGALEARKGALTLEDCACIHCSLRASWKGQDVAQVLTEVFDKVGTPKAILKDGGTPLKLGLTLLKKEKRFKHILSVDDIGHKFACILKAYFQPQQIFLDFIKVMTQLRKKLFFHSCAFLTPPALRSKGRFMGLTALGKWAIKIQSILKQSHDNTLKPQDNTLKSQTKTKLIQAFKPLQVFSQFLEHFCLTCDVVESLLKHFKNYGINQKHAKVGKQILEKLGSKHPVRVMGEQWIQKTLRTQCLLGIGQVALPVSTDILESLFGIYKHILCRCAKPDFNRTTLIISALCGSIKEPDIQKSLEQVSHNDLLTWQKQNVFETQTKQRRHFFNPKVVPKTGHKAA